MATVEHASVDTEDSGLGEIERGSFAPLALQINPKTRLVVATYNIRYAVGSFLITGSIGRRLGLTMPRRRQKLVAGHIRSAALALSDGVRMPPVDVIALQEVDRETKRSGKTHVARELARELQMHYAHAPFYFPNGEEPKAKQWYLDFEEHIVPNEGGQTGLAFLTRMPLASVSRVELPWSDCAWRPRLALEATIRNGTRTLNLYNAHVDPHATTNEQLKQHEAILSRADRAGGPTLLLGDFNTLTAESRTRMRRLLEDHNYTTPFRDNTATWRAGLIRLHTDWIFARGLLITRWGVARRLGVSDHWPVWVEIDISDEVQHNE